MGGLELIEGNVFALEERIMILLIALVLFGKRLPEIGRSLGQALREFKQVTRAREDLNTVPGQMTEEPLKDEMNNDDTHT